MAEQMAQMLHHKQEEFEIDLKGVLNLITANYKLILIVVTLFLIGGIYYSQTRTPLYRSTAMIEVEGSDVSGALESGTNAIGGIGIISANLGSSVRASSAEVEEILLRSPYLLGGVIHQLGLDISVLPHYSGFFEKHFSVFRKKNPGDATVSFLQVPNNLLAKPLLLLFKGNNQYAIFSKKGVKILDGVIGKLETGSYLFEPVHIQIDKINAKPGAIFDVVKQPINDVSDGIAGALDIKQASSSGGGSAKTGIMNLSYVSRNREQAQRLLNIILSVTVKKNVQDKSEEASQTLNFISKQLPLAVNHLQKSEIALDQYSIQSGIFDPKFEGQFLSKKMDLLQQSLEETDFKKMELLQEFTPIHPLVIAVTDKENMLKKHIENITRKLQQLPQKSEQGIILQRNANIQDSIYIGLVASAQNAEMMKASTLSNVKILSTASYPVSRIPVNKRMIIFASIMIGFVFSLAIIFIRFVLSPIIDDPDVVERALGLMVAAIIPCSKQQSSYNKKIKNNKLAGAKPFLLALDNPNDISMEALRSLCTSIQMSLLEAKNNIIAITGCRPEVGKSFVSSNLSVLLSYFGKQVLLIDADIRLGKINQSFAKPKTPGLSTYLQKEAVLSQVIQTIIPGKLDFIATGLYPQKPAELLHGALLDDLMREVSKRYDVIVIDTPPILAVTDAALILRHSATNLMVLGVGKDHLKEVLHAKSMLEKAGVTLAGIVFNTLKQSSPGFGQHYGYNYYYSYGK